MKTTKFWMILISVLLLISAAASVYVYQYRVLDSVVCVYHHGELIDRIHLDTVTTPYTFTVGSDDAYNVISVEQGRVCVSDATCPDHVCINTGWISDSAIPIVCLPNELVIEVESARDDSVDITAQ